MSRLGLAWVGEDDVNSFKKYNRVAALLSVCFPAKVGRNFVEIAATLAKVIFFNMAAAAILDF